MWRRLRRLALGPFGKRVHLMADQGGCQSACFVLADTIGIPDIRQRFGVCWSCEFSYVRPRPGPLDISQISLFREGRERGQANGTARRVAAFDRHSFRSQPMWCFALLFASLAAADVFSGRLTYAPGVRRAADGSLEHFSLHTFRASSDGVDYDLVDHVGKVPYRSTSGLLQGHLAGFRTLSVVSFNETERKRQIPVTLPHTASILTVKGEFWNLFLTTCFFFAGHRRKRKRRRRMCF